MLITKRIKLDNINYYIKCECKYASKDGITKLLLKDSNGYFDGGDLSNLINRIEKNYHKLTYKKYDNQRWFLSDCLYIYDNIPFISGVGDMYISLKDDIISSLSYISKEELDKYIKDNNIIMSDHTNFKLYDERTWTNL